MVQDFSNGDDGEILSKNDDQYIIHRSIVVIMQTEFDQNKSFL